MTSMELMELLGSVRDKYILEAREASVPVRGLSVKRALLVAAIAVLSLLLVGCTYAYVQGWFTDFFSARSEEPLSGSQIEYIQKNEQIILETRTKDDWTVKLKSTMCDGETGYILFGVTAPEDVDLEGYHAGNYDAAYITPGNSSWGRNAHRALIVASTGLCDEKLNYIWQENGYWEADNDTLPNTLNYVIETRCEKLYPDREQLLEDPFGPDVEFTVTFDDFTLEYEDQAVLESIEAKYAGQDYLIGGEELAGLHKSEILAEGEWKFTVTFDVDSRNAERIELISEPVMVEAMVHRGSDDDPWYRSHGLGQVKLTSFVLTPLGGSIQFAQEKNVIGAFFAYQSTYGYEDRHIYVVMQDGSKVALHTDGVGTNLKAGTPIVLSEVDHVLMGDGTILPVTD